MYVRDTRAFWVSASNPSSSLVRSPVQGPARARDRRSSQGVEIDVAIGELEPVDVVGVEPELRQEVVSEGYRLSGLQVRVAGKDSVAVLLALGYKRLLPGMQGAQHPAEVVAKLQPHHGGAPVGAAASGVHPAGGVMADLTGEVGLYLEEAAVLRGIQGNRGRPGLQRPLESAADRRSVCLGYDSAFGQHHRVGQVDGQLGGEAARLPERQNLGTCDELLEERRRCGVESPLGESDQIAFSFHAC